MNTFGASDLQLTKRDALEPDTILVVASGGDLRLLEA